MGLQPLELEAFDQVVLHSPQCLYELKLIKFKWVILSFNKEHTMLSQLMFLIFFCYIYSIFYTQVSITRKIYIQFSISLGIQKIQSFSISLLV